MPETTIVIEPRAIVFESRNTVRVQISMSDYKQILEEADRSVDPFFEGVPESILQIKVVKAIDLNWLSAEDFGPTLSYLIRKLVLDHKKDPYFKVLFRGDTWRIDQAITEAKALLANLPTSPEKKALLELADFVVSREE